MASRSCVREPEYRLMSLEQTLERIRGNIGEIEADAKGFKNFSSEAFLETCKRLHVNVWKVSLWCEHVRKRAKWEGIASCQL